MLNLDNGEPPHPLNNIDPENLAQSFEVEYLHQKHASAVSSMLNLGGFQFLGSASDAEGQVSYTGEKPDGTKITIIFEKGEDYKSPYEKFMKNIQETTRGDVSDKLKG